jgi:hypothetical protein
MLNYKLNKKGTLGEGITWVIATLIILMAVFIFIWISSLISKTKAIHPGDIRIDMEEESTSLIMKTSFAEQLTPSKDNQKIEEILNEQNG